MAVDKYLATHAEPEARALDLAGEWSEVVVMPVRDEGPECLDAMSGHADALLVLVMNQREGEGTPSEAALFDALGGVPREPVGLVQREGAADVLVVDRASAGRGVEAGWGVGHARKLGCDLGLALVQQGRVRSAWLHFADADARLPSDHFEGLEGEAVARVASFRHVDEGDPEVTRATLRYEIGLRHYVLGLRSAKSPFAHHSIGSLISVRAESYAQVRGVPTREAGEDFHLLDKLRKLGPVQTRSPSPVRILSRRSSRAPFGTGPAVERLLAGEPWRLYHHGCFEGLAQWLAALERVAEGAALESELEALDGDLRDAVSPWLPAIRKVVANYPASQLRTRFADAFGGLPTLRLIHALRDRGRPMLAREDVDAPWFEGTTNLDEPALRDHLAALEASS